MLTCGPCVGLQKASACAGCPNQNVCASGAARGPDPGKNNGLVVQDCGSHPASLDLWFLLLRLISLTFAALRRGQNCG